MKQAWRVIMRRSLVAVLCLVVWIAPGWPMWGMVEKVAAVNAQGHLTDEELFGIWNAAGQAWASAGKLNYAYDGGLGPVEAAVKQGDYALAKTELLAYYQARSGFTAFPLLSNRPFYADLIADYFFWRAGGTALPQAVFTVGSAEATVAVDVGEHVRSVSGAGGREVSYMLMGRDKDDQAVAQFHSREHATDGPQLELMVDGQLIAIPASQDTYVHAGQMDQSFGSESYLYVQDSGIAADAAYDGQSRRAYLTFELPASLGAPIDEAQLKLYGSATGSASMDILVVSNTRGYAEPTLTWSNMSADIYSYNGLPGGNDWQYPAGAQAEYHMINSRFQFFGDLVGTYTATGNEAYAEAAIAIMLDFMSMPDAYLFSSTPGNSRSLDVSFRSMVVPRMMQQLYLSPHFTADALTTLLKNIWQTQDWLAFDPVAQGGGNWGILEARSIYAAALYFPEFADSPDWIATQKQRIDDKMSALVFPDGGYHEASYNYSLVSMQSFYDFVRLGDLYGDEMTQSFKDTIANMARFMMAFTLPNGYSPVYGDGGYNDDHLSWYSQIADRFGDQELKYVATRGAEGSKPAYTSTYAPDTKHVVMRSGWEEEDRYLHYNLSTGSHGHMDQNALIAYAYGKVLLTDTGVNDYLPHNPISRWQFDNPASHNTIQIDDRLQHKYHNLSGTDEDTVDYFQTNDKFDFTEGTTYATAGFEHTRSVLFVRPNYWIVSDAVSSDTVDGVHDYHQNWHTLPGANPTLDPSSGRMTTQFAGEANIQVVPLDAGALSSAQLKDGYYDQTSSPNMQYASYRKTSAGPVTFDTVLYPTKPGETRSISTAVVPVTPAAPQSTAMRIDLDDGGRTALYYLSRSKPEPGLASFDGFQFDGKLAYIEQDAGQAVDSLSMYRGSLVRQDQVQLVSSPAPIEDLAIAWQGQTLEMDGSQLVQDTDSATAIAIYAPDATAVTVNGQAVPFARDGDYIYAVRSAAVVYDFQRDFGSQTGESGWRFETEGGSGQPYTYLPAGEGGWGFGTDDFNSPAMRGHWQVIHEDRPYWTVTEAPGKLRIKTQPGDIWAGSVGQRNLIVQTPFHPDYRAETKLSFNPSHNYQAAGLLLYGDDDYYIKLERAYHSGLGGHVVRLTREFQTDANTFYRSNEPYVPDPFVGQDIYLRVTKTGLVLRAEYSGDGVSWLQLGPLLHIPSDRLLLGLHAMNTQAASQPLNADFDDFKVTQLLPNRWVQNASASSAMITRQYIIPGTGSDAVVKWEAPSAGQVHMTAQVASQNEFRGGDDFQVRILNNDSPVWPTAGWHVVNKADTAGIAIDQTIQVEKGDVLSFVTNRIANAQNDVAKWDIRLTLSPE
ncbi:hypothetical protein PA598K_04085 [Paenibacillus sp. 598K]|uniref:heparinase II/III family protein n=1 Tax=Paenibacillus sp. 598K TaxID=1117987 RepID=UPI000FF9B6C2|nr:heparinase II/III family protein [Paenibacillus sp. 598K]GBF75664.1 hypothetical protein PA598K_04085 [Paenibacillus sp. 598K]